MLAKDGIIIRARARVTVRTNLERFVGGATEETIIARVGEGIVSTIGSSESYKIVLESPDSISKTVLSRGLDVGKSDGGFNYTTTDLATLEYRLNTWNPEEIVYVTDGRQHARFGRFYRGPGVRLGVPAPAQLRERLLKDGQVLEYR